MMMLIDKGYYDYDFEKVTKQVYWDDTVKTEEELDEMLTGFGFGGRTQKKPETIEEIQNYIIQEEQ